MHTKSTRFKNTVSMQAFVSAVRLAVIFGLVLAMLVYVRPAWASCPPDERPCTVTGGTRTTKPADTGTTVVTDPAPAAPDVAINVPAQSQPNVTVTCHDFPAPSFDLTPIYRGADGRLNIAAIPWETVRDYLPLQVEWVNTHWDWPSFEAPCPNLYSLGYQDKVDLEIRKVDLDRLAAEASANANHQEEEEAQPEATAQPAEDDQQDGTQSSETADCSAEQRALAEAEAKLAEAETALTAANDAFTQADMDAQTVVAERLQLEARKQRLKTERATANKPRRDEIDQEIADLDSEIQEYYRTKQPAAAKIKNDKWKEYQEAQKARDAAADAVDDAAEALETCRENLTSAA